MRRCKEKEKLVHNLFGEIETFVAKTTLGQSKGSYAKMCLFFSVLKKCTWRR